MCHFLVAGVRYGCRHFTPVRLEEIIAQCHDDQCRTSATHPSDCQCDRRRCYTILDVGARRTMSRLATFCPTCRYFQAWQEGRTPWIKSHLTPSYSRHVNTILLHPCWNHMPCSTRYHRPYFIGYSTPHSLHSHLAGTTSKSRIITTTRRLWTSSATTSGISADVVPSLEYARGQCGSIWHWGLGGYGDSGIHRKWAMSWLCKDSHRIDLTHPVSGLCSLKSI